MNFIEKYFVENGIEDFDQLPPEEKAKAFSDMMNLIQMDFFRRVNLFAAMKELKNFSVGEIHTVGDVRALVEQMEKFNYILQLFLTQLEEDGYSDEEVIF